MPYIYKYVNKETEDVEYVGIIKSDTNFPRRFDQHKSDAWFEPFKYDIYFAEVLSQSDAEALEGHFIAFYGSTKFHNKSKAGWGLCSFAPEIKWQKYNSAIPPNYTKPNDIFKWQRELLNNRTYALWLETEKLQNEVDRLWHEDAEIQQEETRYRRKSLRNWFRSCFEIVIPGLSGLTGYKASKDYMYDSYIEFENSYPYDFEDADDFWDAMHDIPEYHKIIFATGNEQFMYHIMPKTEYEEATANLEYEAMERLYGELKV